jgi:hypothetical protein
VRWRKLGVVYMPDGAHPWQASHAMLPTPFYNGGDVIRIYVTFCDRNMAGRPGWVDVDAHNPLRVLGVSQACLLDLGSPGAFDDNGVVACSIVPVSDETIFMYYVGFELCTKVRYRLLTGLAISEDGGQTYRRYKNTPVLERSSEELYFRCGPYVTKEGGIFRMWYVAGSEWLSLNDKPMPVYSMKYLESPDGLHWPDEGETCLEITGDDEHGFGRPWVVKHSDTDYELFYSIRRKSLGAYRLGYATSIDGRDWARRDREMGLDVSSAGWDSEAIMYSAVIEAHGKTYCFYNGNNFGETGFGVAVLESR